MENEEIISELEQGYNVNYNYSAGVIKTCTYWIYTANLEHKKPQAMNIIKINLIHQYLGK